MNFQFDSTKDTNFPHTPHFKNRPLLATSYLWHEFAKNGRFLQSLLLMSMGEFYVFCRIKLKIRF